MYFLPRGGALNKEHEAAGLRRDRSRMDVGIRETISIYRCTSATARFWVFTETLLYSRKMR